MRSGETPRGHFEYVDEQPLRVPPTTGPGETLSAWVATQPEVGALSGQKSRDALRDHIGSVQELIALHLRGTSVHYDPDAAVLEFTDDLARYLQDPDKVQLALTFTVDHLVQTYARYDVSDTSLVLDWIDSQVADDSFTALCARVLEVIRGSDASDSDGRKSLQHLYPLGVRLFASLFAIAAAPATDAGIDDRA